MITIDPTSILCLTVDGQGVHCVMKQSGKLYLKSYNVCSGKIELESKFPVEVPNFMGLSAANISFSSTGESEFVSLLLDGNRTVYPIVKDSTSSADSIRDPIWLDLPPLSAVGLGTHALPHVQNGMKNEVAVMVISFAPQELMSRILKRSLRDVVETVQYLEESNDIECLQRILEERCDGGRNVLHALVSGCQPTSNRENDEDGTNPPSSQSSSSTGIEVVESIASSLSSSLNSSSLSSSRGALNLRDMMRRATQAAARNMEAVGGQPGDISPPSMEDGAPPGASIPSLAWPPPEPMDPTSADDDGLLGLGSNSKDKFTGNEEQEKRKASLSALKVVCESPMFAPHLEYLLAGLDAQGNTPFMASVCHRAYPASLVLLDAALRVARESSMHADTQKQTLMSMIFPAGSHANASPLHVVSCNDTCRSV